MLTIILTSYNRPLFVQKAIDSMIAQNDPRWRLIIQDDNSDLPAWEVVSQSEAHPQIYAHYNHTREADRKAATRYAVLINKTLPSIEETAVVGYMCDNVEYHPDLVGTVLDYFEAHPDVTAGYVMHGRDMWTADGTQRLGDAAAFAHWNTTPPYGPRPIAQPMGILDHSQVFHRWPITTRWDEDIAHVKRGDAVFFDRLVRDYGPIQNINKKVLSYEHLIH